MVIQKQRFFIVDTHEPAITMPLSPLCLHVGLINAYPYKNQIFQVGHHQGVRHPFVLPGLHITKLVSCHCRILYHAPHTSTVIYRDDQKWWSEGSAGGWSLKDRIAGMHLIEAI